MDDYKEIRKLLKPRRDIKASDELRQRVSDVLNKRVRNRKKLNWLFGGISLSAVAAVLLLLLIPSGISAKEILSEAIKAIGNAEMIEMVAEVRTRPIENFRYIDINEDFVAHHIDISRSDSVLKWRVDKGERIAISNGTDIYTWMPSLNLGWHLENSDSENVLGYIANLLKPREILETELNNFISNKNAEYKVKREGNDIILTVKAPPQGNFDNPYLLNTSISESENIRRYVLEADTKRLKSATVSVLSGDREIVVLKISSIKYENGKSDINCLPKDVKFIETENRPDGLKGLSAEEAASAVLNAFENWNDSILAKVMIPEIYNTVYRDKYHGSKLISIGRSFTSGIGNSIFVPYTLELRDKTIQRHNIALQKTDSRGWVVVGGL
ncbi:MAG: hypothetical protein K2M93_03610 [Muribaculaceae bacterium]|nr:hypothetical protein [Muribaculaceae bacterium]